MNFPPGVLFGNKAYEMMAYASEHGFAVPVLTVNTTSAVNAALEAAAAAGSPIALQLDEEGAAFFAGAGLSNADSHAGVIGAVAAALHVHTIAKAYGVPVLLGTDGSTEHSRAWLDGLLHAGADFNAQRGYPLFSWHKVDFSALPFKENLALTKEYLRQTADLQMGLVIALGSAAKHGMRENNPTDEADQHTSPLLFARAYKQLNRISPGFMFSGVFGRLTDEKRRMLAKALPYLMKNAQEYIRVKFNLADARPLVFSSFISHDTTQEDIQKAIETGAVSVNVDLLVRDALWEGVGTFVAEHADRSGHVSDPDAHFSNPDQWLRAGEKAMLARLSSVFQSLNAVNRLG